jgi:DNA-binding SARP family transcriptional activator
MGLVLKLFGQFTASRNGAPVKFLYNGRNGLVLAYLLLHHDQLSKGVEVADLFWSEYTDKDGCLRTWCKRLRNAVGDTIDVKTIGNSVQLILKDADVDVITFDAQMDLGEQGDVQALRRAVGLAKRGPLLQDSKDAWIAVARKKRKVRYVQALHKLAMQAVEAGQPSEARKYHVARARHLMQALLQAPSHEASWCDVMEAFIQAGERIEAMAIYRKCQNYFQSRQLSPPPCMMDLYNLLPRAVSVPVPLSPQSLESEPMGGAVPLDSPYYIVRNADAELYAAITRRDSLACLKGPSQIGKTSLLARGLALARQSGVRVVLTDFRKFSPPELTSIDSCFRALAQSLADQLDLDVSLDASWKSERSAIDNLDRFLRREVLCKVNAPLVWGLEEIDRLFYHKYKEDVFGLFRAWHDERALDPSAPWHQLTLALTYTTESYLLISDLNRSPFNVVQEIAMEDLTFEQVADLNQRYGAPLKNASEVERFCRLIGGHPYLARRGLGEMKTRNLGLASLEGEAEREMEPYGSHLERLFVFLTLDNEPRGAELIEAVRRVLQGKPCPSPQSFYRLRSAGVFAGASEQEAGIRCRLYENFLRRRLQ